MRKALFVMICLLMAGMMKAQDVVMADTAFVTPDEVEGDSPLLESEGKIGPYAVTFFRNPADIGEGNEVGYYYYNERPNSRFRLILVKNVAINAKGSMHVVLKEYTAKGNHTGTFDGQYECRGGGYVGTFTNSKGKKYHFELMEK